jgi:hypothetical protein
MVRTNDRRPSRPWSEKNEKQYGRNGGRDVRLEGVTRVTGDAELTLLPYAALFRDAVNVGGGRGPKTKQAHETDDGRRAFPP